MTAVTHGLRAPETGRDVAHAMVRTPVLHDATASVAQARAALADPHRHMLLVVEAGRLVGTLTRDDLGAGAPDDDPALRHAQLERRTVRPDAPLDAVHAEMLAAGERRRAVVDEDGVLVGLLCLKTRGTGFCSDAGIAARAAEVTSAC